MMFSALIDELNICSDLGIVAEFWWRDDDLQRASRQLDKLLEISDRHQAPVALATIPRGVEAALAERLSGCDQVSILQHGYSHQNFAPLTERKMELGWHRSGTEIQQQIGSGLHELKSLFDEQFVAVMAPPWNRIDPRVISLLQGTGLCGLSTTKPRIQTFPVKGIKQVNVHVNILDWKQGNCFAGESVCIEQMVAHLYAKREGQVDPHEPTGIMSHHQVHDDGCWNFLEGVFDVLKKHPNVQILDAASCFTVEKE